MNIRQLRTIETQIVSIGSHHPIIQSMLDFDFLSGKKHPSVRIIIAGGRKFEKYFFGNKQILIPVVDSFEKIHPDIRKEINLIFNTTSARRATKSTKDALSFFPQSTVATIFAETVPEHHSLDLYHFAKKHGKTIIGPASVGLLLPGSFKLVGEIIRVVSQKEKRLSFALSFGGDRFPVLTPKDAFLAAQEDLQTDAIVYYGELGGSDEYDLVELLEKKKITKKVFCYIAGTVSDLFETPPQFGHAKAIASTKGESAREKRDALKKAGALVGETFEEFVSFIAKIPAKPLQKGQDYTTMMQTMSERKTALITTTISSDHQGDATILGENLLVFARERSFAAIVASMFLGRKKISKELELFVDFTLRLLVDHGPYVSGAVNTIVTARAGRDLVSSLATGLLTIGPRFGGAINQAAANWLSGVNSGKSAFDFVEEFAAQKVYISGIGHRKYRIDLPDPRVAALLEFANTLKTKHFTSFALDVQKVTTAKKGNLILNVDGAIAAVLLDLLSEKEGLSNNELQKLTEAEFFNSLFVLSRSVGFIAHFLDQKRLDEGLFRLPDDLVAEAEIE